MYTSRDSSAYKLEPIQKAKPVSKPNKKEVKKKHKIQKTKFLISVATFFLVAILICSRYVNIYGMHSDINKKTSELNKIKLSNEQTSLYIDSMIDSSKVEEYAISQLGLRKIENRQIVYLQPNMGDNMQKVAKNDKKSLTKGIFGMLSGAMEYLK